MDAGDTPDAPARPDLAALLAAVQALLQPLAQLAVTRGLPCGVVEESLRAAFVDAALRAHADSTPGRAVSRVSAATGLNRREVGRLIQARSAQGAGRPARSPVSELVTRWLADPALRDADGLPVPLPRQGPAPSFEALAQTVTRDVHPRSLLQELLRLGVARLDAHDAVHLAQQAFVPREDQVRMLGFLAENVGDHLHAAVENVGGRDPAHVEQAIYQDAMSATAVEAMRPLIREHWRRLLAEAIPRLEALEAEDRAQGRPMDQRLRLGLFSYSTAVPPTETGTADADTDPPTHRSSGARRKRPPAQE
ncbi:hypothetical protein JI742_00555 [Piscinibacter sp. Jin2]|uniref:Uncharacterized protein n=1 Tax=Aquariibacter lacus TaxID=2801332 RepID=A0A9X1BQ99_9BURK|nr:DUF6502 family protein [Piscinibacter lacus]MBL0718368.1 hypothetical protein [Piscinibacter lacus]